MEQLMRFFSPEAGQRRRTALEQLVSGVEQFIPPNLRPAAEAVVQMNPVQGISDAMSASGVVFDPAQTAEARRRAAVDMGVEMAMTLAPAALVRMGYLAAPAGLMETFATPSVDAAVDMGRNALSDAQYAVRSIGEGDFGGVFDALRPGGQPQSLSAAIPVYQGRSRRNLDEFFNPQGVSWGTNDLGTAELFAGKSELSELYPNYPGQVYNLEFDLNNPMDVDISETLWSADKEMAKVAEAKAAGHDGLRIIHPSGKIDYVAFDPSQVKQVGDATSEAPKSAPTLSAGSVLDLEARKKAARQLMLDNPGDEYLSNKYREILAEYNQLKDASATARAESRPKSQPEVDTSYRGSHQPVGPQDENPIRLDDVTKSITGEDAGYPEDFYGSQGMRLYAQPPSFPGDEYGIANQQSYRAIQAVRGNPDAEVTIYRGVPDSDDITTINPGDFVTLSPKYAELHAASGYGPRGEDAGKVISQRVKVRDVYFAGDDVNEFGYFPTDVAANASKPTGLLVLEQQARGKPDLKNLFDANNIDISDLSKADPGEIKGVLDMAVRRQVINPRQAESYLKGLLD